MREFFKVAVLASAAFSLTSCSMFHEKDDYDPKVEPKEFRARVDNPWMPLLPGTVYRYRERKGTELAEDVVTVTNDVKNVMGVPCTVVHDVVSESGKIKEDTYDWYAQDQEGNVWYFGEDAKAYDERGVVSTEGSWEAGVDGAKPGIIMFANPQPGPEYWQEHATDAQDKAQVVALRERVQVPFGNYTDTVRTKEWSELEVGSGMKWYARGVGFVRSQNEDGEVVELVEISKTP